MYDDRTRLALLLELRRGSSLKQLSKSSGVSRATRRSWPDNPSQPRLGGCPRCDTTRPLDGQSYAHMLGLYLGDGCISIMKKGVFSLRVSCDAEYPRLVQEVEDAFLALRPGARVFRVTAPGCVIVQGLWKHWPCLFPQHGPGRKHLRPMVLEPWQCGIVAEHPDRLLRGLFNSDGCRITNWTVRQLADGPKRYEYPRYFFSNESTGIMSVCTSALDQLGVNWRMPRANLLSVARKDAVASLDLYVGPKS